MHIKNKQVLCIGEVLWDRFPLKSFPGGAPLNVGIHLNKLGGQVILASRVGDDQEGKALKDFMVASGLSAKWIQEDKKLKTSEVLIQLDENNNANYDICQPVAWDQIEMTKELEIIAKTSGVIVYGSLASRSQKSRGTIQTLLAQDAYKIMDVNLRELFATQEIVETLMAYANMVKLNEDELAVIAQWHGWDCFDEKTKMEKLASLFQAEMVCLTKGQGGALLFYDGEFFAHPGFQVNTADTVGAGDAFLAGLVYSFIVKKPPGEALAFACALGALVASKMGATPVYTLKEINEILSSNQ